MKTDRNNPKNAKSSESTYTVMEFQREFPDDRACLEYLWRQNHAEDGSHAFCSKCGTTRKFHKVKSRTSWSCDHCGKHIHPTANTIFHKSSTSLQLWFYAIYLMSSTRCGISAKQLERELGVAYKTAWRMAHLIRGQLMEQDDLELGGKVEVDEVYVGGKPSLRKNLSYGQRKDKKTIVLGMVERQGRIHAEVIPNTGAITLHSRILKHIQLDAVVYTDELGAYKNLKRHGYVHHMIRHKSGIYAQGHVHTQTIEGFWSQLQNSIRGTHKHVSKKWMQSYVNEFAFRYNYRGQQMFPVLLAKAV